MWCTVRVYYVYWQIYQVPLLLICLGHFRSFFNTQPAIHRAYFIPCDIDFRKRKGRGGRGVFGLIFASYVPLASQSPYLIIVYSVANCRAHLGHFGQINNIGVPSLVTFCFNELTHFLDWMKNTLLFICSTNILVRLLTVNMKNCLTPKIRKCATPF